MTEEKVKKDRTFARVKPCKKCPFRTDVPPYLRPERVQQIATDVQNGAPFWCHETTVPDENDDGGTEMTRGPETSVCAGSIILMEKQETPNQHLRIAERLGMYDRERMHLDSPVHASWYEMQQHFADPEEDGQTCEVVAGGCEAPAGYMIGGAVVAGTEFVDGECTECGRPACDSCLTESGRCVECVEEDEDED